MDAEGKDRIAALGPHFAADDSGKGEDDLASALDGFLRTRPEPPRLLGLGEPLHGVETFPLLRNRVLRVLVDRQGYRSIAIESDSIAGLIVDDYVTKGVGDLEHVLANGFSHGFGALPSSRELVRGLREHNDGRDPAEQVRFYGFDAPLEMMSAQSPRRSLTEVHRYLTAHLEAARIPYAFAEVDRLLGEEAPWTTEAAAVDPTRSVGNSPRVQELRIIADDLFGLVESEAPDLLAASSPEEYGRMRLFARTAVGLLRYHASVAETAPVRLVRMPAIRDTMMADNLQAIMEAERLRGPTLVFAHNGHLQRHPTRWNLAGNDLRWWSAGALAAVRHGTRYAVIASALGTAPSHGLPDVQGDSLEGVLADATEECALYATDGLTAALSHRSPPVRSDTAGNPGYFPLDPGQFDGIDAIAFVRSAS